MARDDLRRWGWGRYGAVAIAVIAIAAGSVGLLAIGASVLDAYLRAGG